MADFVLYELIILDGVHPEHNTLAAYGWIRKGEERKLLSNGGCQRINLHGGFIMKVVLDLAPIFLEEHRSGEVHR